MELACKLGLAYRRELACKRGLACKLALERKLALQQVCELELGRRKQFLHIQLRLHFQNRHQQCCKLQFVYDHQATKLCIGQKLSIHHDARFVQSLLHYNHLEQHIHIDKQLVHLHKRALCHKLELEHKLDPCHKPELEHGKELVARRHKQQPKVQSVQ